MTVSWNISFGRRSQAVLAATFIGLGCGTLYVYSAYSTQLADRLGLSATQSSLVGMCGSVGVSLLGILAGVVVDRTGPFLPTLFGGVLLLAGYMLIFYCYYARISILPLLALGTSIAGFGSSMSYSATLKTAALNFPSARGTATAFPISTFGLSAFFFSSLGALFFPGNTTAFLLLLAFVTSGLSIFGSFFLHIPHTGYHRPLAVVSDNHDNHDSFSHQRQDSSSSFVDGTLTPSAANASTYGSTVPSPKVSPVAANDQHDKLYSQNSFVTLTDQLAALSDAPNSPRRPPFSPTVSSSTLSTAVNATAGVSSSASKPSTSPETTLLTKTTAAVPTFPTDSVSTREARAGPIHPHDDSHSISGWTLLRRKEFWAQCFVLAGLSGICQMYIYCVGYIVRALALANQETTDDVSIAAAAASVKDQVQATQALQVSIISLSSFGGRIISGVMSDVLNQRLGIQRLWMIFAAAALCLPVHIILATTNFTSTTYLWIFSAAVGLSYGLAFGVYPTIVADTFGMFRYSQNWGMVCASPVLGVYIFNLIFGKVYDNNSVEVPGSSIHVCFKGAECYSHAFKYTTLSAFLCLITVLWMIWTREHQHPSNKYIPLAPPIFETEEEADEADELTHSRIIP